ncbi:hypothetical protein CC78DRAFT_544416 [Lojkania enalia]|uniref:Uncharacterized protein n=1 Tax=Lojkania enalia TaxID=147567 RepID=A0A9P4K959_9PLEO|nr:hypothetical protein CC78DRAFT_544416 [Didymosphaeria enalia]
MKSLIILSLGATTIAAPLGLDRFYNAVFGRDETTDSESAFSILPFVPSGTGFPTATGTETMLYPTATGTSIPLPIGSMGPIAVRRSNSPRAVKPLSIKYNLAPTIVPAAEPIVRRQVEEPEFSFEFPTSVPTATGTFPTSYSTGGTGTGYPMPTGTGVWSPPFNPTPSKLPEVEAEAEAEDSTWLQNFRGWFSSKFGGK